MMWLGHHAGHHHRAAAEGAFVITAAAIAYGLTLALSALVARILPPAQYGEFSSAVALVSITCTCATLGLEKYALRLLPEYLHSDRAHKAKGFVLFGVSVAVALGVAVAFGGFHLYRHFKPHAEGVEVLGRMIAFVPAIAVFLFVLEVATTFKSAVGSTLIYRIVLPGLTLGAMAYAPHLVTPFTVNDAVNVYGYTWLAALVIMIVYTAIVAPRELRRAGISLEPRAWLVEGMEFLGLSLLMSVFAQSAILMLEVLRGDRIGVAHLSACMQISGLAIILQTATIRTYGPRLARLIAAGDFPGQTVLLRQRALLMMAIGGAFLAIIVLWGERLLRVFGDEYTDAYPTLVVLTIGNIVNIVLGGAPLYLQFHGLHRTTLGIAIGGTVLALGSVAAAALMGNYETVAKAYVIALIIMYAAFQVARRAHTAFAARAEISRRPSSAKRDTRQGP